ncbi:MAG: beta-galactosidase [Prevotella sp.]|nr:beta-galactosidase [Prevotella sp.]
MKRPIMIVALALLATVSAEARETYNFNSGWRIDQQKQTVTLPHAWNEDEAFGVSTFETSTGVRWYRKEFSLDHLAPLSSKKIFIEFEGARQAAEVFVNGQRVGISENGVMAFGFDLTPFVKEGVNKIEVRTDNDFDYREEATGSTFQWQSRSFNVSYGGLNKNVWLHVTDQVYQTLPLMSNLGTTGTYIYGTHYDIPGHAATIHVESQVMNDSDQPVTRSCQVVLEEMDGRELARFEGQPVTIPAHGMAMLRAEKRVTGLHFWSWGYGYLYKVKTVVGQDEVETTTGFRKTEFKDGMIYLNDRVLMVHGYAQRTTNEWPGVGQCVPAWLSDYSNDLFVQSGGNLVRWMHTCPWKQDVESCDRVGLLQAMPAGDSEKDATGRWWTQRKELMRDAIIYMRNSPSVIFYECGNHRITAQHMREMKQLRNQYDPYGGRAIGSREMLDEPEAEYGGEMLYVNKSDTKPVWMMEYCRDEALRWYWNSWSYPYHAEGDGPTFRGAKASAYNHNNDRFVVELVRRWHEYWLERPGTGTKVNSGGTKIVLWNGWVDDLKSQTYIVGHWNYAEPFVVPEVYVVGWKADGADVALVQVEVVDGQGRRCPLDNRLIKWNVKGPAEYRGGVAKTKPFSLATNPAAPVLKGEKIGSNNPLGIDAKTYAHLNHVLQDTLPVECGVNRVMLRSLAKAGKITVTAQAKGLPKATIELQTQPVSVVGGLTAYKPSDGLMPRLNKGETPLTPSFIPTRREVAIIDAVAGTGDPTLSFDTYENTIWESEGKLDKAWITYTLAEPTTIDEVCLKLKNFRSMSYPVDIYAAPCDAPEGGIGRHLAEDCRDRILEELINEMKSFEYEKTVLLDNGLYDGQLAGGDGRRVHCLS